MFKKQFLTVSVLIVIALSFIFVKTANTALETQLLVDVSPSSDYVPYQQTQWYGFTATGGKGYCAILTPSTGNSDLYLFDNGFNLRKYSKNTGTTVDKVWYGQSTTGPFHLACYGVYNPSSNFTIQVITAPYAKSISPTSGASGTLVTISGFGFGATRGTNYVRFGTVQATSYYSWTNTQIKVYVPSGVAGGVLQVIVYVASKASNPMNFTTSAVSSEGTMFRYDLARTGNYPNGPTTLPLNVKWKYYTGCGTHDGPVIANNILYISADKLYALDANTGSLKWSYPVYGTPPAVANNTVFIGGGSNTLYALDANTGSLKWSYIADGYGHCSPPAVLNNIVYFSTGYKFYALDVNNGNLKWSYSVTTGQILGPFPIANGLVYFTNGQTLYALDASNGSLKWMLQKIGFGPPAVVNNTLYVCTADDVWPGVTNLCALDASTGILKWKITPQSSTSTVTVSNGVIYTIGSKLYAFDANNGAYKWEALGSRIGYSFAAVSNSLLYVISDDGNLYARDINTGEAKWSYNVGSVIYGLYNSPAVSNGKVYVHAMDGYFYCFGQKKRN